MVYNFYLNYSRGFELSMRYTGDCELCPSTASTTRKFATIIGIALGLFLSLLATVFFATEKYEGTLARGVFRARDFAVYIMMCIQMLAVGTSRAASGLPDILRSFLSSYWIPSSKFRGDPSCMSKIQDSGEVALHCNTHHCRYHDAHNVRNGAAGSGVSTENYSCTCAQDSLAASLLLYSPGTSRVMLVLPCKEDGTLLWDPYIHCDEILPSLLTGLIAIIIVYPLWTSVWMTCYVRKRTAHQDFKILRILLR